MIRGTVTDEGEPIITMEIAGTSYTAVIDTGFNGDLELPEELKSPLNAEYIGQIHSMLAAGQYIEEESYLAEIVFDGVARTLEDTFASQPTVLIGTRLLQKHRLEIDFAKRIVLLQIAE